ncbi:unnamed protein product, partial [marine sediment metagenome]
AANCLDHSIFQATGGCYVLQYTLWQNIIQLLGRLPRLKVPTLREYALGENHPN